MITTQIKVITNKGYNRDGNFGADYVSATTTQEQGDFSIETYYSISDSQADLIGAIWFHQEDRLSQIVKLIDNLNAYGINCGY